MCGICGIHDFGGRPVDRDLVEKMTSILRHRGPDGMATYCAPSIGLGHRRLSIIDLEGGAQPITNEDGTLQVIFNGEIYNFVELREELEKAGHIFRTRSDTEVIVHGYEQWGVDCVTHFNGIFAFALWDSKCQRLVLARDHVGVKPLYYLLRNNRLVFASEIKSILLNPECRREIHLPSLATLFTLRYVPSPDTLFANIKKLKPGHLLIADHSGVQLKRYWLWKPSVRADRDEDSLAHEYRTLLEDSVRLQMRSDVPVGLFLSSGVDSSALLALMTKHSPTPIQTFTIGFEEGGHLNETSKARALAEQFGANHTEMIVGPEDYKRYFERYLWDLEEPVGHESAPAFYFVSWIARKNVKVALSGQGADEPWAGYNRYLGIKLSQIYYRLPRLLTDRVIRPFVDRVCKDEKLKRGVASLSEPDVLTRFVRVYSFYDSRMKERLFLPWLRNTISSDGIEARHALEWLQNDVRDLDPLTQMLYIDTRASLTDDLLMVGDKTSMANSVEVRVPYLDPRIIEFVESLSPNMKLRGWHGKYLHKKALQKWIPKEVISRKKQGFDNPMDKWLRDAMRPYLKDCLLSDRAAIRHYFDQAYVREMLAAHEAQREDYVRHIYLLLSFELWHRQFISN
jgi:asparagine synthase (glutamine-hydrolysing)